MTLSNMLMGATVLITLASSASAHIAFWHPSMWGFNVTDKTFPYDNRPVVPLMDMTFDQWWWHGYLKYPPNKGDFFELPAGGKATAELACHKGATTWFASSEGPDIRQGNWPCPNSDSIEFHANNINDVAGCALAITYKSNEFDVQPEDFAIFSTNRQCVWNRYTDFEVPAAMPECPPEGCICSWFWIHAPDSGGEQNYMTPFRCKVTGAKSTAPVMKAQLPRRCGADPANGRVQADARNCTVGAKQPFYWYQKERNNMFEGTYSPPQYNELYGYDGGACDDIFEGSSSPDNNQQHAVSSTVTAHVASTSAIVTKNVAVATSSDVEVASSPATEDVKTTAKATSSAASFTPLSSTKASNTGTVTSAVSAASATSTRRCKSRKSKRTQLELSSEKRAAAPRSRKAHQHNVGRFIADSTFN